VKSENQYSVPTIKSIGFEMKKEQSLLDGAIKNRFKQKKSTY